MPKIEAMWAWISIGKDAEDEGIVAWNFSDSSGWMPLVGADKARIMSLKHLAQTIARLSGQSVKLVKFSTREEMEVLQP